MSRPASQGNAAPDPGSFGGHPYTPDEIALGYGTDHDPRFAAPSAATGLVSRPRQTSLLGERERPVGPLPGSFVLGDNATLIAAVAPLYLTGSVLDVTYGRGMWWRRFSPASFGKHDLALDGVDFRELPEEAGSWDTVCFDPPYIPTRAAATASPALKDRFRSSYGLNEARNKGELDALIAAGLAECGRVARTWVLAKCSDYAENASMFVLGHVSVIEAGQAAGLRVHDLIVHAGGGGPGRSRIKDVRRSSRTHSYLVVFAVPRRRARKVAA